MGTVRTVLGEIEAAQLGVVLAHEHIICRITEPQTITEEDVRDDLRHYLVAGGGSIVELTNTGMGQRANALARLSRETGVGIIAGTGFYTQPWHPPLVAQSTVEELETFMVREIEEGIDGTDVPAGVIGEIGTSREAITPDERKVMQAAARAARRTGTPLSTHTSGGRLALQQLDIIAAEGLPLERVSIGHLDLEPDPDYHTEVARSGAFVQYDTFGKNQYRSDEDRMNCLAEMVRRGFAGQLLLSNDISRATYLASQGGWGYCHLLRAIVPEIERQGVSREAISLMLRDNPARFLSLAAPAGTDASITSPIQEAPPWH
jgi:phosphotriesterase-related protein